MTSVSWGDIAGKPTLATVATSGSYNDLIDKPSLEGLATETYVDTKIAEAGASKQDKLVAGTNITIDGNVISASGGSEGVSKEYVDGEISRVEGEIPDTSKMVTTDTAQSITGVKKWYDSDNNNYLAIGQDFGNGKCIEIGNSDRSYVTIDKSGIEFGENSGITLSLKDPTVTSSTPYISLVEDRERINLGFDSSKVPMLDFYNSEIKVGTTFKRNSINHYDNELGTSYTYSYPSASGTLALTSDIPDTSGFVSTTGDQYINGIKKFNSTPVFFDGLQIQSGGVSFQGTTAISASGNGVGIV